MLAKYITASDVETVSSEHPKHQDRLSKICKDVIETRRFPDAATKGMRVYAYDLADALRRQTDCIILSNKNGASSSRYKEHIDTKNCACAVFYAAMALNNMVVDNHAAPIPVSDLLVGITVNSLGCPADVIAAVACFLAWYQESLPPGVSEHHVLHIVHLVLWIHLRSPTAAAPLSLPIDIDMKTNLKLDNGVLLRKYEVMDIESFRKLILLGISGALRQCRES